VAFGISSAIKPQSAFLTSRPAAALVAPAVERRLADAQLLHDLTDCLPGVQFRLRFFCSRECRLPAI
jgi:hypothetical protein